MHRVKHVQPFAGKTAVVTGASRGIGLATAELLASQGARLVLVARSAETLEVLAERLGGKARGIWALPWDLSQPETVGVLGQEIERRFGPVDVLVHNAGAAASAPFRKQTLESWRQLFALNVEAPFFLTQAILPGMLERRWGRVLCVASVAALTGDRYIAAYAASKHALLGWTRSLAAEVAPYGVTVNAICPGYVDTPMTEQSIEAIVQQTGRSQEEVRSRLVAMNPQGRFVTAAEVAYWIAALAREEASSVNGQTVVVDGGALRV